jgi:hypothetical protein
VVSKAEPVAESPVQQMAALTRTEAAAQAPKPSPPPGRAKPSPVASAEFAPEITVLQTSWHPTPSKRAARVKIAGGGAAQQLREGEDVGALRVVKIEPSAVVFTFQGRELRRAVGK